MGIYTQASKIDFFRIRRHGAESRFRFLKDGQTGYVQIAVLSANFFVNRRFDTQIGARIETLTFDAPDGFDFAAIINDGVFGDLVESGANNAPFKRYRLSTETAPTALTENRYRFQLAAAFDDKTPIV